MPELFPWPIQASLALPRILAIAALFCVAFPWLMFPFQRGPGLEPYVRRGLWTVFTFTVLVHLLSAIGLYEAVVVLVLLGLIAAWTWTHTLPPGSVGRISASLIGWLLDLVDRKAEMPFGRRAQRPGMDIAAAALAGTRPGRSEWLLVALVVALLGAAAAIRFTEAFSTPAPALSDAPVNLAWLKYVENNLLYHDEVYPRGMYAFLSLIRKFTALNALVVLDLTGPLVTFAIVVSLAYFVFRTTRSVAATAVAVLLYGVLPHLLPVDLERHAAHNSQEYGLIFVLPAAWFAYAFLVRGQPADRAAAAAAAGVAVFTHAVSGAFAALVMTATSAVALLGGGTAAWRRLPGLVLWVAAAAVVALAPLGIALALGQQWHGESVAYLQRQYEVVPTRAPVYQWTALGALVIALLGLTVAWVRRRTAPGDSPFLSRAATAAVVAMAMAVYLLPNLGINLQFLADRSGELAGLGLALAAGLVWSIVDALCGRIRALAAGTTVALVAAALFFFPPRPIRPYHYYTAEQAAQYLRADASLTPGSWTLVTGPTGYALALGRGYHAYPDDFVALAGRLPGDVAQWLPTSKNQNLGMTQHYVLMVEKVVPLAPFEPPENARPRLAAAARLQDWIDRNRSVLPLRLIFAGSELDVWLLTLPDMEQDPFDIYRPTAPAPGPLGR